MVAVWFGHAWGHGWGGPWFLLFPLFWLAVVVTLVVVFRRRRWDHSHGGPAEQALGERYARGEITEQEYRQRMSVLRERPR